MWKYVHVRCKCERFDNWTVKWPLYPFIILILNILLIRISAFQYSLTDLERAARLSMTFVHAKRVTPNTHRMMLIHFSPSQFDTFYMTIRSGSLSLSHPFGFCVNSIQIQTQTVKKAITIEKQHFIYKVPNAVVVVDCFFVHSFCTNMSMCRILRVSIENRGNGTWTFVYCVSSGKKNPYIRRKLLWLHLASSYGTYLWLNRPRLISFWCTAGTTVCVPYQYMQNDKDWARERGRERAREWNSQDEIIKRKNKPFCAKPNVRRCV